MQIWAYFSLWLFGKVDGVSSFLFEVMFALKCIFLTISIISNCIFHRIHPTCPNCSKEIGETFNVFPDVCDYRQKTIRSLINEMSSAVSLLDPNSQQNAMVAIQKLLNIDADEDVNQATHLYINNFAVAKTNIEDMKSQLFGVSMFATQSKVF